nr:DEAD/DEAH box helicase [Paenibacillus sp. NEAU-GSW1]
MAEIEKLKQEINSLRHHIRKISLETNWVIQGSQEDGDANVEVILPVQESTPSTVHRLSNVEAKLALYKSYFRGREDVYPIRWNGKNGKSGYSPVCGNEWTAVCQKPKVKCSVCTHQRFLPITDDVLSRHLDAREDRTIGIYPMLEDETCWFLAMDFDKKNWKDDALAVMQVCKHHNIPAALERSRSGNGGHIWIFFMDPIAACLARQLGTLLLSLTMRQRYQLTLDSYDRLFPNQDTLPKGGFGNLIALPLQGGPRKNGNSTFVDESLVPYEDQWRFLYELGKMSEKDVMRFIQENRSADQYSANFLHTSDEEDQQPWESSIIADSEQIPDSLPQNISVILSDRLYIEKKDLTPIVIHRIMRMASFSNPDFYKTQAMRLSTYGKPRVISCAEILSQYIVLPRGCLSSVTDFIQKNHSSIQLEDNRFAGRSIQAKFVGQLTTLQDTAARSILVHDTGVLSAATGFGKTVVAASIVANRKVNTLILVHRRELMEQWKERFQTFLDMPKGSIGTVGGGKDNRTGIVDIAIVQSLNYKGMIKEYVSDYGQIIVDECHHVSAFSFEQVLKQAKAKFIFGLTATPKRQDGQEAIVAMQLGPIRMRIDTKMLGNVRGFTLTVIPRYTMFRMPAGTTSSDIQNVYQSLVADEERNTMIFDDLLKCLDDGRSPLLLVERTVHAEYFEQRLKGFAKNVIVLRGGMGKKQREAIREKMASIPNDEERIFIATGKLIGEGFDDPRLDTLFLVHPISWSGTLQQYAGRLHRAHINKEEVKIFDYVDLQVPVLMSMYKKRVKGYRKMGYRGAELL